MVQGRTPRWLALSGVAFAVLEVLAFFVVAGSTPDEQASAEKVVTFYKDHLNQQRAAALVLTIAAVVLVFFGAYLREALTGPDGRNRALPTAAFGGAVLYAGGLLFMGATHFAVGAAADQGLPDVTHALNILDNNNFLPTVGGIAVLALGVGLATVLDPVLPRWLGWASIVLAVLALAGPLGQIAFFLILLWGIVVSVMLYVQHDRTDPAATPLRQP